MSTDNLADFLISDPFLILELLKNISEGIYLMRLDTNTILYANDRFEKMFGYEHGEMIGKEVSIINAPTDQTPQETRNTIVELLTKTGEWHGEVENIKKDGTRFWCYANVSMFEYPKYGKMLVSVHTDITEKKEFERKQLLKEKLLSDKMLELENANKLMIGRELKMVELKDEIEKLRSRKID